MKLLIQTIILLFVVVNIVSGISEDEAQFLEDIEICKLETNASDSDVREFMHRAIPSTKAGKCLHSCVFKKLEMMTEEKFVGSKLVELVETEHRAFGNHGKSLKAIIKEIADECEENVADADECEAALKVKICLNVAAKKRDFCPNVF